MSALAFGLELARPAWLAGLVILPLLVLYFVRSLVDFGRAQRMTSLVVRGVVVVLLTLALAGLTLVRTTDELYVVFLRDRSQSVGAEGRAAIDRFVTKSLQSRGRHRAAFLDFGREPGPILSNPDTAKGALNQGEMI